MDITLLIFIIIAVIIVGVVFGIYFARSSHMGHRMGEGMFKSSEYNLEEKDDISDKEYYDKEGLFK